MVGDAVVVDVVVDVSESINVRGFSDSVPGESGNTGGSVTGI